MMLFALYDKFAGNQFNSDMVDLTFNTSIAILGIAVTLFTVVQSLIESKQSHVDSCSKAIKENREPDKYPMIYEKSEKVLGYAYIKRMKKLVIYLLLIIIVSIVLILYNLVAKYFTINASWFYVVDAIVFCIYLIGVIAMIIFYINSYCKNVYKKSLCKCIFG